MAKPTLEERFWAKVDRRSPDECWPWTGAKHPEGYGQFWDGHRIVRAYRWLYEQANGPIPDGLTIDHLCRNPQCVNPIHLEPVTMRENILRGTSPSAQQARQTHCIHGHPFDEINTYYRPDNGARKCRRCNADRERRRSEGGQS